MRAYSYKITRDFGFAPNPFHGVCTLATCKPKIRKRPRHGDLIVGCGSSENKLPGKVICILRVADKCTFQEYWDNPTFAMKRPYFKGSLARAYGDNIYHKASDGSWIQERSHHSYEDGSLNEANLETDTSSDNVLWANDFVYFGRQALDIPSRLRSFDGEDLYPSVRDYRVWDSTAFVTAIDEWFRGLPDRGRIGRPVSWR